MTKAFKINIFAWMLAALVSGLAFYAWGETYSWRFSSMNAYKLFPLFGLVAFSLMWSHYIIGAVRRYFGVTKDSVKRFLDITSGFVLVAILLHPGLLWWQLWRDDRGLPPFSAVNAVPETLKLSVIIGMVALAVFLSFELRRYYAEKTWWKYIEYACVTAMALVFVHAIRLGGAIDGWYMIVWVYYGISLLMAVAYSYYFDFKHKSVAYLSSKTDKSSKKH